MLIFGVEIVRKDIFVNNIYEVFLKCDFEMFIEKAWDAL